MTGCQIAGHHLKLIVETDDDNEPTGVYCDDYECRTVWPVTDEDLTAELSASRVRIEQQAAETERLRGAIALAITSSERTSPRGHDIGELPEEIVSAIRFGYQGGLRDAGFIAARTAPLPPFETP